mgnify:CR=1 FL=1
MLGGPDGSDATDPNDPLEVAIASLVAGRAATVAPGYRCRHRHRDPPQPRQSDDPATRAA